MNPIENLSPFVIPIISKNLTFEEFANLFNVWRHGKDSEMQKHVLSNTNLLKYFHSRAWDPQFIPFINYAANLGVHDALYYTAAVELLWGGQHVKNAMKILQMLGNEGHALSTFTYHLFSIFHYPEKFEESVNGIMEIIKSPGKSSCLRIWLKELVMLKLGRWEPVKFNFDSLPKICPVINHKIRHGHYSRSSIWIYDLNDLDCLRCKVAWVIHDFCENYYNPSIYP